MNVLQAMVDVDTFVLTILVVISVAVEMGTLWRKIAHALVIPMVYVCTVAKKFMLKVYIKLTANLLFSSTLSSTNETTGWRHNVYWSSSN